MKGASSTWSDYIGGVIVTGGESYYRLIESVYVIRPSDTCVAEVTEVNITSGSILPVYGGSLLHDSVNREAILPRVTINCHPISQILLLKNEGFRMMKIHRRWGIVVLYYVFKIFPIQAEVESTVSLGSHPYASFTGDITSSAIDVSVPSDFLITDIIITQTESTNGFCGGLVLFETDSSVVGRFRIATSVDGNEGWGQGLIAPFKVVCLWKQDSL